MFRIKICGITRPEDARAAAEAGADAIGLNFYSGSKRFVSPSDAQRIVAALPTGVAKVGVFVNASAAEIADTASTLQLDWIQLHGDEPPEFLAQVFSTKVVKAFRCGPQGLATVGQYLQRCQELDTLPAAVLVDSLCVGEYGGSGQPAPWALLSGERPWLLGLPLILAGGLKAKNVAEAIRQVRPDGVDTASGVEVSPGVKDAAKIQALVDATRKAWR